MPHRARLDEEGKELTMQRNVKRVFGIGGLLLLCAGLVGCGGTKAQSWTFKDDEGTTRTLSHYRGQVLVLGFTNTWCDPCQEAAQELQALQERFRGRGVKVMAVSSWERGNPDAYMQQHGYTYGVMTNGTEVARDYDVDEIPTFFVVGVDGNILSRYDGYSRSTSSKIAGTVEKYLKKVAKNPEKYRTIVQGG
jgi:cytochrome c biogenesis protein CcmG/thiol:disulfide interchange protein DsbE